MAKIKPFKGLIYNKEKIRDLSQIVCPPYDVISPVQQQYYHSASPHNLIHILLGKDIAGEDKYQRAASLFKDWQKNQVFIRDTKPAIYFYSQQYNLQGEKKTRLGFIALLQLDEKNPSVFGHERTRLEPKEDRLKLLRAVKANLSPIFVLFPDKKRVIQRTYQQEVQDKPPFIDITDSENTVHRLWRLDDEAVLDKIQCRIEDEKIFIADGHHRYEVACAYRDELKKKQPLAAANAGFNYILTYFSHTDSPGLTVLPIHRLLKLDRAIDMQDIFFPMKDYFNVEEIKDKTRFFFLMKKAGITEHVLGVYKDKKYWLLRLKNIRILDKIIADKPREYKLLDVAILNYTILKNILGLDWEKKDNIVFIPDASQCINEVDNDNSLIAFLLNPVKISQIVAIALSGEKMPPKSTYFYPKVLSGLVINKPREDTD